MSTTKKLTFALTLGLTLALAACAGPDPKPNAAEFQNDITGPARPWTQKPFDNADDKFTFAVFSDLNGGERDHVFEIAVAQLALLRPEFIIGVGDLIKGSADPAQRNREWDSFDARAERATAPIFYVGGNHDLTGVPLQQNWDQRYGRRYYSFVYRNVLFLVLDTEDNTPERSQEIMRLRNEALQVDDQQGYEAFKKTEYAHIPELLAGNVSAEQSAYFRRVIAEHPDVRWTFLFMHKAPWERPGERNFAAIEAALADRPYTVFHGHVHTYAYQQRHGHDYIRLATTGGTQVVGAERSMDEVALVTVSDSGVDIANLLLAGILDRTGHVPLDGDTVCFEKAVCGEQ